MGQQKERTEYTAEATEPVVESFCSEGLSHGVNLPDIILQTQTPQASPEPTSRRSHASVSEHDIAPRRVSSLGYKKPSEKTRRKESPKTSHKQPELTYPQCSKGHNSQCGNKSRSVDSKTLKPRSACTNPFIDCPDALASSPHTQDMLVASSRREIEPLKLKQPPFFCVSLEAKSSDPKETSITDSLHSGSSYGSSIDSYAVVYQGVCELDPDTLRLLNECGFYYPALSMAGAKEKLRHCKPGTFLLRDSAQHGFILALSIKTKRGTTSIRIKLKAGKYILDCEELSRSKMPVFTSPLQMLDYFTSEAKTAKSCVFLESTGRRDTQMLLKRPCYKEALSLKDLCRRKLNSALKVDQRDRVIAFYLPASEAKYMQEYPHRL